MTQTCDFPVGRGVCSQPVEDKIELLADDVVYRVDVCAGHRTEIVESLRDGFHFRPIAAWVDGKRRDVHVAASGAVFTTADARAWAIDKGLKTGAATGRVSLEHIELYAAEH